MLLGNVNPQASQVVGPFFKNGKKSLIGIFFRVMHKSNIKFDFSQKMSKEKIFYRKSHYKY